MALAARPHRRATGGCRHARAVAHRLDAQPRAHGDRELAEQELAPALAARRALVLGYAGRRRSRQQYAGLAMDRRMRRGRGSLLSRIQSIRPGREIRSRRGLSETLAAGTGHAARALVARTRARSASTGRVRLSAADGRSGGLAPGRARGLAVAAASLNPRPRAR